jgi:hypothetical protein
MVKRLSADPPEHEFRTLRVRDTAVEIIADALRASGPAVTLWAQMDEPVLRATQVQLVVHPLAEDRQVSGFALGVTDGVWRLELSCTDSQFNALLSVVSAQSPIHAQVLFDRIVRGKAMIRSICFSTKVIE